MKTLKKLFSVSAIIALAGTLVPMYAFGSTYGDELEAAYTYAHNKGVTTMSSIDNADMYGSLTRIALAKMIANYAQEVLKLEPDTTKECSFPDVSAELDKAYDNGVTKACQLGLMGVGITKFDPNSTVTRAQFGTTFSRALNANDAEKVANMNKATPRYKEHLAYLKDKGIMKDTSNPDQKEVRGYVMLMMMRADEATVAAEGCSATELLACLTADDYDACIAKCSTQDPKPEENKPGYASVSAKPAATQNVALNAVEKKIGTVTLKAGKNDTTVTNIEITKSGLGDPRDVLNLQLMKDGEYVSNTATLTSKRTATLRFSPKLVLKANSSETFDVVVSMDGTSAKPNGQHDFSVTAVTVANGTFGGTPARLGSLVTTNYTVGTATSKLNGELATEVLAIATPAYTINAGDEKVEFASLTIKPTVESTITAVTLTSKQDELNRAFSNVKAYIDDAVVGNVTINDETIVINGLKETVKGGKTLDIVLKGDVKYVGAATNFVFYVDDNHVTATEVSTSERVNSTKSQLAAVKVSGVDLTLKNLVKKTKKVAPETDDVVLLDMELSAGADLQVNEYYVDFGAVPAFAEYEDSKLTLYVDGVDHDIKAADLVGNVFTISSKKESFYVSAGDKISVQVKGSANDTATTAIGPIEFGINSVKNTETNKTITGAPLIKENGHKTTYAAGDITIKNTKKGSNNLIEEGSNSDVLSFRIKGSNERVTVKKFTATIDVALAADLDSVESVSLYKSGASSALVTVDNDDFAVVGTTATIDMSTSQVINQDATEEYVIKAKLSDGTVTTLGKSFTFTLTTVTYRPSSASVDQTKSPALAATYNMSSVKPAFTLVKNGNKIEVNINNASEYDLKDQDGVAGIEFSLEVIGEFVDGNDLLQAALDPAGTWLVKDESDNVIAGATATYGGNVVVVKLPVAYTIDSNRDEGFTIEMPQQTTIKSNYYTTTEKGIKFRYTDGSNDSSLITATY